MTKSDLHIPLTTRMLLVYLAKLTVYKLYDHFYNFDRIIYDFLPYKIVQET